MDTKVHNQKRQQGVEITIEDYSGSYKNIPLWQGCEFSALHGSIRNYILMRIAKQYRPKRNT